jgi:hypothetical protein
MLESKLNVPHRRFQHVFVELSEPCSSPERVTVPLLKRKEDGLSH